MKHFSKQFIIVTAVLICANTMAITAHAEQVTVSNSVSVSASGGTAKASIKTVVNGEVIEDETYTSDDESIEVTSSYVQGYNSTNIEANTSDTQSIETLRTRLMQLLALLQYYVSLLES